MPYIPPEGIRTGVITMWKREANFGYAKDDNNHKEYFAEGTEAYLYRNDFHPFVAAELETSEVSPQKTGS